MAMLEIFSNNAITTVATGGLSISATTLNLASGTGGLFPNPVVGTEFFRLSLTDVATRTAHEITYCTARSGDVCTIVRAQEGTTAQAWLINDIAGHFVTAGTMTDCVQFAGVQNNTYISAIDTGTANVYKIALNPSMPTSLEFAEVIFRVLNTNTGASTLQINSGTVYTLYGLNGTALQGGELVAGGECKAIFNGTNYYIEYCTTGALQIVSGSKTNHATNVGAIQQNKYIYASSDTGTANTYKPVISPAPIIITGSEIIFTPANANTGASTIQINATGTVYNLFGLGNIALQGGEIIANGECKAIYDGTQFVLEYGIGGASQIGNPSKSQHATTAVSIQQNATIYGADTGTTNTYKPTISPAPTITAGSEIMWSAANGNTGASTIQINGTGTIYNLYGFANIALQGGEIVASGKCKAVYNGTQFVLEYCTGGALQIADAINSQQASSLNQVTSLLSISVPPLLLMAQGII